jgi:hypothetical protein
VTNRISNFAWIAGAMALAGTFAIVALGGLSAQQRRQTTTARPEDKMATETSGFYCNLKGFTFAERVHHGLLSHKLAEARVDTRELADGYAFLLRPESVSLADLADWVSNERKCCPFFDFNIEIERDGGPMWLKLRGSEGVKQFIRSEFGIRP